MMAAAHYQFDAIHPFADGNGRTGRILNISIIIENHLLHEPVLYLSRYIIRNRAEYYRRLLSVTRHGSWEDWLLLMIRGVETTSHETLKVIDAIQELQVDVREAMKDLGIGSNADLLEILFEQPYSRISDVMDRCRVPRPTATKWLNELKNAGLLTREKSGKELIYINHRSCHRTEAAR